MKSILIDTNEEFKRLYHGRGDKRYKFLTVDSINEVLFIQFFEKNSLQNKIIDFFKKYPTKYIHIIIKERYSNNTFAIKGKIPKIYYAIENKIKFKLNFLNKNIGFFGDIKNVREFVGKISKNKKILNLFAYTCGFSLYAKKNYAREVYNVDMSKSALSIGMHNHQVNNLYDNSIKFLPYNILKSFKKIKKFSPFDIIIIDPPTYQKNSFVAKQDYIKLINQLSYFCGEKTIIIACVNDPKFSKDNFLELFKNFKYIKEISPAKEYVNSTLKSLVFEK